jgi:hypothetical protein
VALHSSAIISAELSVVQSRRELRDGLRGLTRSLSRPSVLAAAAIAGAVLGFSLNRRGPIGTVSAMLALAVLRRGVKHLLGAALTRPSRAGLRPAST